METGRYQTTLQWAVQNEGKALTEKSPKKRCSDRNYPFQFFEKNHNKKSLAGRFQKKIKTAVKGTEHTVTTNTRKISH